MSYLFNMVHIEIPVITAGNVLQIFILRTNIKRTSSITNSMLGLFVKLLLIIMSTVSSTYDYNIRYLFRLFPLHNGWEPNSSSANYKYKYNGIQ